ncbi:GNAT family N-acetyltransferase [Actinoplanes sp. NPDC049802]|uniref:GNAT family N-acetyltransferase n=1 Tax=Actinoplanes sp. NPDC049802 TaxID=3154742 RepID=UPI0033CE0C2A
MVQATPTSPSCGAQPMTGWLTPTPAGDQVLLRPPTVGDEPALIEMATDPEVRRYIGGPVDRDIAADRAARKVTAPVWGQFVIVDRVSGEVVGSGSLARKRGPWEISYQLRRAYWGRGLANRPILHQASSTLADQGSDRCSHGCEIKATVYGLTCTPFHDLPFDA